MTSAIVCLLFLLNFAKNKNEVPMSTARSFSISEEEEETLILKSELSPTGNEAYKLYRYYLFSQGDSKEALRWLRIAVNQGHSQAANELKEFEPQ
jgi:hypothetical protein